jgi:small nuclear ribonucleoprotein (snRNP)-like protein
MQVQVKEPTDFLKNAIGKSVRVKLNSGFSYKGIYFICGYL